MIGRTFGIYLFLVWVGWQWPPSYPFPIVAQDTTFKTAESTTTLVGNWNALLEADGTALGMVLEIRKNKEGKFAATIDTLNQQGIPVSSIDQIGDSVKLELSAMSASFEGKMNTGESEIAGEWKVGTEISLRLVWRRSQGGNTISGLLASIASPQKPTGPPASLAGFEDDASFVLIRNEEIAVVMRSTWKRDGSFESHSTLAYAGQTVQTSERITPDADGRWAKIVMEWPGNSVTLTREGTKVTRRIEDKTTNWETRQDEVLLDDKAPALLSQALRAYDRIKSGPQKFPGLVLPGEAIEIVIEAKEIIKRTVAGRNLALIRYFLRAPGVDSYILADASGKLYLMEIPAQKLVFLREGFEGLRRAEATDPLLSAPKYEVHVERGVNVPMRDGVKLAADVYRPEGVEKAPVILVRTPYKKELLEWQASFYARRGYIYAVEDCRGRFGSSGTWEPFMNESNDGYDTVEWLAQQSYSNGRVGMLGGSYLGWVQWWAAVAHPPHLVTIIPNVTPPDPFYNIPYDYGVFFLWGAMRWADVIESNATADISGATFLKIRQKKYSKLVHDLPVIDLDKSVLGKENKYWREWIQHPSDDSYWQPADYLDRLKDVNIPVFHQSGWFDSDGIGTKLAYLRMESHQHPYQKLTIGPWAHTDTAGRMLGERDFGETAMIDLQRDYLRWFDHWLKGTVNGIDKEPLVSLFVMGSNKWLYSPKYPLEITRPQKLYLASNGHANTENGDGKLTFDAPPPDESSDHYSYDPGDPTPDPRFYEESEDNEKKALSPEEHRKEVKAFHHKITRARKDILVYQTPVLTKPMTFVGPLSAVLYASSSARDTDWFIRLMAVDEDGKMFSLTQGKIRARYRKSMQTPELLQPNEVYAYTIDLWQTGITVPAGAQLRVEVASAAFPFFSRNLNTGGHNETETKYVTAEQTIYHDAKHPSHILLPVVSEDSLVGK